MSLGEFDITGKDNFLYAGEGRGIDCSFEARGLARLDWLSKADPIVAVFAVNGDDLTFVGKTEQLKNVDDAAWAQRVYLPFNDTYSDDTRFRFVVYDIGDGDVNILKPEVVVGFAEASAAEVRSNQPLVLSLVSDDQKQSHKLAKKNSTLQVGHSYYEPAPVVVVKQPQQVLDTASYNVLDLPTRSLAEFENGRAEQVRRRVVRQEEVPYWRRVKVPVVTRKVVPCYFNKRVKVRKLVQVPAFEEVEETYTVFEEHIATRDKDHWIQVEHEEEYTVKVPRVHSRWVKKPMTKIEEQDHEQVVTVQGSRVHDVEGFRIDEIEDTKVVEFDDWEEFELVPHVARRVRTGESREVQNVGVVSQRFRGTTVYADTDHVDGADLLEIDHLGDKQEVVTRVIPTTSYTTYVDTEVSRVGLRSGEWKAASTPYVDSRAYMDGYAATFESTPVTTSYVSSSYVPAQTTYVSSVPVTTSYTGTSGSYTRTSGSYTRTSGGYTRASGLDTSGAGFVGDVTTSQTGQHGTVQSGQGVGQTAEF
jgi:hypothetical protein